MEEITFYNLVSLLDDNFKNRCVPEIHGYIPEIAVVWLITLAFIYIFRRNDKNN
jgi:hypothetical protein